MSKQFFFLFHSLLELPDPISLRKRDTIKTLDCVLNVIDFKNLARFNIILFAI